MDLEKNQKQNECRENGGMAWATKWLFLRSLQNGEGREVLVIDPIHGWQEGVKEND